MSLPDFVAMMAAFICGMSIAERRWIGVVLGLVIVVLVEVNKSLP